MANVVLICLLGIGDKELHVSIIEQECTSMMHNLFRIDHELDKQFMRKMSNKLKSQIQGALATWIITQEKQVNKHTHAHTEDVTMRTLPSKKIICN